MRVRALSVTLGAIACAADPTPREVFDTEVVPAFERSCASPACHGVAPGAVSRGEVIDWSTFTFDVDAEGAIRSADQAYRAALRVINTVEDPAFSTLLRKPLTDSLGGLPHYGGDNWLTTDDPDYQRVLRWIEREPHGGEDPEPLDEAEADFARTVQPTLVSLTCTNGNCHGPTGVGLKLDAGVLGRFPIAATRGNRAAVGRMLALDGFGELSRLIRKALPLHDGGIVHKGGNRTFLAAGKSDPRFGILRDYACRERMRQIGQPCVEEQAPVEAFVFVRGPVAAEDPFTLDQWQPGSDLYLARVDSDLAVVEVTNLTATLHGDPADVRDPAVDATGTRVAFAMRTGRDRGHELWILDLPSRQAQRLTWDAERTSGGALVTYRDPTFGPDDSLWYVSTLEGALSDDGTHIDSDVYSVDLASGATTRWTWTPQIEIEPTFLRIGEEAGGEVLFTALRQAVPGEARAHSFRFPPDLGTEYHQHFGITPRETLHLGARETPDGRYVEILGELGDLWGGRLAIVDRNFGPELGDPADPPALPAYADPLARLDWNGVVFRDPAPLPDGRILVAATGGPVDPRDPSARPEWGISLVEVADDPHGAGPVIVRSVPLLDEPGVGESDPEPVTLRAAIPTAERKWDPAAPTGMLVHQGVQMISALLGNLPPSGTKEPLEGAAAIRLVQALPWGPSEREAVPAAETRHGLRGATSTGLFPFAPQRVLAEIPLPADGTAQVEIPAGTAFRIQTLDAEGMAIGPMHNRWFEMNPGQRLPQGIQPHHYDQLCAACHGSASGDPTQAFVEPDVLTTASLTLSRYEKQNPRRPIPPAQVGGETQRTLDYLHDVAPILERERCARCHGGGDPAGGLTLGATPTAHYTDAYESLLAPGTGSGARWRYVDGDLGRARASFLVEVLAGVELDAEASLSAGPHPRLEPDDLATVARWIELGAPYDLELP